MIVIEKNILDEDIIKEIRKVEAACKEFDGLGGSAFLDTSFNFNKDINSIFLMYEDKTLVSVLSMFMPTKAEAEISAFTLPEYRSKGYLTQLYNRALSEIKKYEIEDILFVCEPQSKSGRKLIDEFNASYDFTEYMMRYTHPTLAEDHTYKSRLCIPSIESLDVLADIGSSVYSESFEESKGIVKNTLESDIRMQYALEYDGRFIGIGSVSFENEDASIYGIGIMPEYQGKGFGKELMYLIVDDILKKGYKNITLEVNSKNDKAYNLYKKIGFMAEVTYDYYRLKTNAVKS